MTKFAIRYTLLFLLLVPAQGVIFDHLTLFGVAIPLVFIWLITALPVTIGTNLSLLLGFAAGFGVDIFCDTPGLNALCCTILAFVRKPLFHLYVSYDDDIGGRSPSSASMGHYPFMKYLLTAVALYCIMLFTVEAFHFFNLKMLCLRIICSTAYTFAWLFAFDCLVPRR